jgi:putative NIF3 family GTP cyclohydrolase 1 type 2
MTVHRLSRREFVLTATAILSADVRPRGAPSDLTAQQVVDRIRATVGVPWRDKTVDGFRAGDPATPVTGIATAVMATMATLRKAAASGRNLLIVQEPTFYAATDDAGTRPDDPMYVEKKAFIAERRLVVWRFSDHWNARQPGESSRALGDALGWSGYRGNETDGVYHPPETTVSALAAHVRSRLSVQGGLRVVGRSAMRVRTVAVVAGGVDMPSAVARLARADALVVGEPREWEAVPYALDTRSGGAEKALVAVGRVVSEEPGVRACADWIRSIVKEVPVEAMPIGDPYWNPRS